MPISARQLNWRVVRVRNELEYRAMHRRLPTLYLYYRPHRDHPPYFFFRRQLTTTKGCTKVEGRLRRSIFLRPPPASEAAISPSLPVLSFRSPEWSAWTSTQHSEQPSSASQLLHCTSQTISLPLAVGLGCMLTGLTLCCSIFGILSMQCYTYYHRYPLDRPFYKILVR